jgi:phosphohistidine phosphatase
MKRLAVLRHAKSSWDHADLDDHDRPLNERGWKAARRIGKELSHRHIHFDVVLASTAARVRETIDGVQEKYDFAAPIRFEPRIYLASAETLLAIFHDLPETVHAPLLVGHNPGLERLIVELTHDDDPGLRHRVAHGLPTAAFAIVELPVNRWSEIAPGSGKLVELILPKELD